mmetsp:Transcript_51331/g.115282  ORF Transcript_51331/g.115282 Transcript_51331/m.115282 type:complete len:209 (+) Transcript_51331:212-838(+)
MAKSRVGSCSFRCSTTRMRCASCSQLRMWSLSTMAYTIASLRELAPTRGAGSDTSSMWPSWRGFLSRCRLMRRSPARWPSSRRPPLSISPRCRLEPFRHRMRPVIGRCATSSHDSVRAPLSSAVVRRLARSRCECRRCETSLRAIRRCGYCPCTACLRHATNGTSKIAVRGQKRGTEPSEKGRRGVGVIALTTVTRQLSGRYISGRCW